MPATLPGSCARCVRVPEIVRYLPIFKKKAWHSAEFPRVVGHQGESVNPCHGCDLHVVRPNWGALLFQVVPNLSVLVGCGHIEWQANVRCENGIDLGPVHGRFGTFQATNIQLPRCDRTNSDFGGLMSPNPLHNQCIPVAQKLHPNIGVEKIDHSRPTALGSSPWGGRTKDSSAMDPARSK